MLSAESWVLSSDDNRKPATGRPLRIALGALLAGAALGVAVSFLGPLMAALGLAGLALGVAIFAWPELGVLAFIAVASLLPFAVLPVRIVFSPTLVDAVLTTLLAAWLFWALQRGRPLEGSAINALILLYLGLALTSFVLGLTYSISPERVRLFMKSLNGALLFFGVLNCVRTRQSLGRAIQALMLGGFAAAVVAMAIHSLPEAEAIQLLSSLGPLGYPTGPEVLRPIADTKILRAIGTSIDPNVLGGLLMMASALLVGQIFSARPLLGRHLLLPMAATTVAALLLTQSRGALGGLVVGAVMVGILRDRRLLVLMAAMAAVAPFVPQASGLLERLASGLTFQDRAAAMRLGEYENALRTIAEYPWFGIGFGEPPSIDLYLGVSNMYLFVGQEMGLIGLTAFLAVLGGLAWQVAVGLRVARDEEVQGMLLALAAALAAAAAAGMLDHYFVNILFPHMVALFWLYAGLATVAGKLALHRGGRANPEGKLWLTGAQGPVS